MQIYIINIWSLAKYRKASGHWAFRYINVLELAEATDRDENRVRQSEEFSLFAFLILRVILPAIHQDHEKESLSVLGVRIHNFTFLAGLELSA